MGEGPARVGPYEVVLELAAGGMAVTYVGRKRGAEGFERLVVIKRVHRHLLAQPEFSEMLRDEGRIAALLRHPNVVPVEDVVDEGGELCLVMPYVESVSLSALIAAAKRAGERLAPRVASRVLLDALAGLHAAHEATDLRGQPLALVHRDMSPRNVLVGTDGQGRLIDFGVAKAARRLHATKSGILKGTLAYMSPEQLRRRELDRRADIFAAGAVLYEALAGAPLFDGTDEADVLIGVLADEIPELAGRVPEVPPEVDAVLAQALARDREERFATAADMAEALTRALPPASEQDVARLVARLAGDSIAQRREAIRGFLDQAVESAPPVPTRRRDRALARNAAFLALLGASLLGVASLFFFRQGRAAPAAGLESTETGATASRTPSPPSAAPSAIAAADDARVVELHLVADRNIDSVRTAGLQRVEIAGTSARLWVMPWSGTLLVEASLGAGTVIARFDERGPREQRLSLLPPPRVPSAKAAPLRPPHSELHQNPYR